MKNQNGFSLIELLIVVVVIGIIAAIAIPNLLGARRSANEGSAISAMRVLHQAQVTYSATVGGGDYAGATSFSGTALSELGTPGARIIDENLDGGTKSGYEFQGVRTARTASVPAQFAFSAKPLTTSGPMMTGTRRFGVATAGVLVGDSTLTHYTTLDSVATASPMNPR